MLFFCGEGVCIAVKLNHVGTTIGRPPRADSDLHKRTVNDRPYGLPHPPHP